jgi:hypothetical protein
MYFFTTAFALSMGTLWPFFYVQTPLMFAVEVVSIFWFGAESE